MQRRFLPSTSMLLAFDAAARTGSFSAAAEELSLTQAAISRQVQALEEQLDVRLFHRASKKITLTVAGVSYAREIRPALMRIQSASLGLKVNLRGGLLNLAILPTFGTRWLIPRFPSFLAENPTITVNFITKLSPFDPSNEAIHAAIHFGLPDWPKAEAVFLMREKSVPVTSPQFVERHRISRPSDLGKLPLLQLASRLDAWTAWFAANEAPAPEKQGLLFEEFATAAQAAASGLGVALLPKFLIEKELERGELVVVFDRPVPTEAAYYLMIPSTSADYRLAITFRDWLLKQSAL